MYNFCPQHWPHALANEMALTESNIMLGHELAIPMTHENVQSIATHHHKQSMWFIKGKVGNIMVGECMGGRSCCVADIHC